MRQQKVLVYILLLFTTTLLIYGHTSRYGFLNWDDNKDILNKPRIEHLNIHAVIHLFNPTGIFEGQYFYEYFPITDLVYMIEWHFYGREFPQGFHIDNIILQLINVVLIFFSFLMLLKIYAANSKTTNNNSIIYNPEPIAFITAMMFAVSPMIVEAVSWLACRKDLLLLMFYLLWFIAYMKERYVLALIMFILAVLSKFQGVTIPGVLVAYELFISRHDIIKVTKRIIPYILILLLYVPYTMWYYSKAQTAFVDRMGVLWTIMFIPEMVFIYIRKLFLPFGLVPVYTVPGITNTGLFAVSLVFCLFLVVLIIRFFKNRMYLHLFGLSWFFLNLIPVSNIISLPTKIADRYVYEASIGIFLITGIWGWSFYKRYRIKAFVWSCILIFSTFIFLSYWQTLYWANNISLWTHTLSYQPDSYIAWNNLGTEYNKQGQTDRAIYSFEQALRYNPDFVPALWNMGSYYLMSGQYDKALPLFLHMCEIGSREQYMGCRAAGAIYLQYYDQPSIAKKFFEKSYILAPHQPGAKELERLIQAIQ